MITCDVSDEEEVAGLAESVLEELGTSDVLVAIRLSDRGTVSEVEIRPVNP